MSIEGIFKGRYEFFKQKEKELHALASNSDGQLEAENFWRYSYYNYPYLLLETDSAILERFTDIFTNSLDISSEGKISITPMMENEARLDRLLIETIEETNCRGILTQDSFSEAKEVVHSYFEHGEPIGVKMFREHLTIQKQWLLKFSKKQYVKDMYKFGHFRISPASYYAKGSHIRAIKDLETARNYKLKALVDVLEGKTEIEFKGQSIPIKCGFIPLQFMMNDYYLFSTCTEVSRRMPTDFESDAVLVIKNKTEFVKRIKKALLEQCPDWEFLEGTVYYFDPYNDMPKDINQEFWKHFAYSYQREHRCILRQKGNVQPYYNLEPFFIEIGSLSDISEPIFAI